MIGCKVMRTLTSVEFEIILILELSCCLSSRSVQCLENVESRVPVPFPEDPYEAIRQAYLVKTETPESPHTVASPTLLPDSKALPNSTPPTRHDEDLVDSDTSDARSTPSDSTAPLSPDHPLSHASPTLVPILRRTAFIAVRVSPAMSPGLSASIKEVAAMSDSMFRKRFRSFYESSPSSSPPDLPLRKRYRGTSELVEDDEEEDDDEVEDEEVEESLDSDSESEEAKDEGPTAKDEDPTVGDAGLTTRDEGSGMRVESLSLGRDEVVPECQQRTAPVMETAIGEPLELGYGALRRREIALGEGRMPSVFEICQSSRSIPKPKRPERVSAFRQPTLTTWIDLEDGITYIDVPAYPPPASPVQTSPSLEWSSGSLFVFQVPFIAPLPISSPMIPLTVPLLVTSPATAETKRFLTELGA
nr:hypothetical protein [Tanacetum cinerariifolium]